MSDDTLTETQTDDVQSIAAVATERQTLTHVIEHPSGVEAEITVREPTLDELEALEAMEADPDTTEEDVQEYLWDEYLVDDIDRRAVGTAWIEPITNGIVEAFLGGEDLDAALDAVGAGEDAPGN